MRASERQEEDAGETREPARPARGARLTRADKKRARSGVIGARHAPENTPRSIRRDEPAATRPVRGTHRSYSTPSNRVALSSSARAMSSAVMRVARSSMFWMADSISCAAARIHQA